MSTTMTARDAADLFRAEPDRYIDIGGAEVAHRQVGSGPDVLFVHGWPVSGATFRRLLPHLADHLTCHLIDLPGAGSSRFTDMNRLSIATHVEGVRATVDHLGLEDVAVVGHDSGGMIARHAMAGDPRLRAMGLIDTEPHEDLSWRFRSFVAMRNLPGFGAALGWLVGQRRLRRTKFVLGDAFLDASHLDGEFEEFFLEPIHTDPDRRAATMAILATFDSAWVDQLAALHRRIDVPVQLVWGAEDVFFPLADARRMLPTFADARLEVIERAGLFSHEERPAEVAAALLPVLSGGA